MSDRTYPPLPQALGMQLEAVRMQMEFDPAYLLQPECPYSEQLKAFLRQLVTPVRKGRDDMVTAVFKADQDDDQQVNSLLDEVAAAINSMKALQKDMDSEGVDTSDRLTFFKNYSSMMERFLSLKEKAAGMKQLYEFQRIVIQTMEQVLDKDQVLEFKNKLKAANLALPS